MNYTGRKLYPTQTDFSPARDCGTTSKYPPSGIERGGTEADYNAKLRGPQQRIDRKPKRPYP